MKKMFVCFHIDLKDARGHGLVRTLCSKASSWIHDLQYECMGWVNLACVLIDVLLIQLTESSSISLLLQFRCLGETICVTRW